MQVFRLSPPNAKFTGRENAVVGTPLDFDNSNMHSPIAAIVILMAIGFRYSREKEPTISIDIHTCDE